MNNISSLQEYRLPEEITANILIFLDLRQISRIRSVCKLFDRLAQKLGGVVEIKRKIAFGYFVKIDDSLNGFIHREDIKVKLKITSCCGIFRTGDKIRVVVFSSFHGFIRLNLTDSHSNLLKNH